MAQATRSAPSSASGSNDPIESLTTWLQLNSKPILYGVGGLAAAAIAIVAYRSTTQASREKASVALAAASAPFAEGKYTEAQSALEKVTSRYGSTASGQQAVLMLAQVLYEQKKYDDGIKVLEKAAGSGPADFRAGAHAMVAAGHEMKGEMDKAAAQYAKAADAASFPSDKRGYQASQARSLMAAGKAEDARKLWETLAAFDGETVQQEANVRLGELAAKK